MKMVYPRALRLKATVEAGYRKSLATYATNMDPNFSKPPQVIMFARGVHVGPFARSLHLIESDLERITVEKDIEISLSARRLYYSSSRTPRRNRKG